MTAGVVLVLLVAWALAQCGQPAPRRGHGWGVGEDGLEVTPYRGRCTLRPNAWGEYD